jgi:hypothetical protein
MMIDQEVLMRMEETQSMKELRERNELRLKEAKEKLGQRWLLHPSNIQQRMTTVDANRAIRN